MDSGFWRGKSGGIGTNLRSFIEVICVVKLLSEAERPVQSFSITRYRVEVWGYSAEGQTRHVMKKVKPADPACPENLLVMDQATLF